MNGVLFSCDEDNDVYFCKIESFTNELKEKLRSRLAAICEGEYDSTRLGDTYSYYNTLDTFIDRINGKKLDTKKGMVGELICHLLITEYLDDFTCASPFFNLEERNIKKGHDLVYYRKKTNDVWAVEVKSGENGKDPKDSTTLTLNLLGRAHSGISDKLDKVEKNIWRNALKGLHTVIGPGVTKNKIEKILSGYKAIAQTGEHEPTNYNVMLSSVLFNDINDDVDFDQLLTWKIGNEIDEDYGSCIVFSFHKNTYQAVIDFIEEELKLHSPSGAA